MTRTAILRIAMLMLLQCGCASRDVAQRIDYSFEPVVAWPAFAEYAGPAVLVDAAHDNFHTINGRYRAFARLLERDGYVVRSGDVPATRDRLSGCDVYVVSNALAAANVGSWELPTPSAFLPEEIDAIEGWVADGGSLLLVADHMPFPGAAADLAAAFGIVFYNGFAMGDETQRGIFTLRRSDGTLADHAITRGRNDTEGIEEVMTFTGQAFRGAESLEPLLHVPDGTDLLLPVTAWEFSDQTPRVRATGLLQGAVLNHGAGRVAVFGEAAMFTAQTQVRGGEIRSMGMNHPDATDNQQFVLNVMHWLTGLLDDD